MALSLYNKYRPQTFKDVVGQEHIEKTLANAVEKNTVSHAYLFCGPRGTGKTTTARILAKALLCDKAPTAEPDGICEQCREVSEGIHPDVYELDAASRTGVDNVREEIIGRVNFAPTQGAYKIFIIDEVHMLSTPAFNALLKTLEEPPSHVVFVLCTTGAHKVPDTVQARCQRFDFKRLGVHEIVGRLQYICEREGFDNEPAALELIAKRAQGGMRDAIRSLEQVAVFSGGKITYSAAESLLGMVDAEQLFVLGDNLAARDAAACFDWVSTYVQSGSDIAILVNDLATHVRNLYAVSVAKGAEEHIASALEIDSKTVPELRDQAARFGAPSRLGWMLTVLGSLSAELKNAANARLALEVALTRILCPQSELSIEALAVRVAELEERLAKGGLSAFANANANANANASASASASANANASANTNAGVETVSAREEPATQKVGLEPQRAKQESEQHSTLAQESSTATQEPEQKQELQNESPQESPSATQEPYGETTHESPTATQEPEQEENNDQRLYRQWNSVVDAIKKVKSGLAANLGGVTPALSADGSRLTLELPAGAMTSQQYLQTDSNKTLLAATVAKIFGEPKLIMTKVAPGEPKPAAKKSEFVAKESSASAPEISTKEPHTILGSISASAPEPSTEELNAILGNTYGDAIQFKEDN